MRKGWLGPYKGFALLASAHLAISAAYAVQFRHAFAYRRLLVPLHVSLVAAMIGIATLGLGALIAIPRFRTWRGARWIVGSIPAALFTVLVWLYLADYVSNTAWGFNVTFGLAATFLPELAGLGRSMPFSTTGIYIAVIAISALIFGFYLALSRRLAAGLEEMFLPGRTYSLFRDRIRTAATLAALVVLATGFAGFMMHTLQSPRHFWTGEPLVGFWNPLPMFGSNPHRVQVALEDHRIRDAYPRNLSFQRRNVFLFIVDSLRADHMQIYGYERPTTPFLASLMERGRLRKVQLALSNCSDSSGGILTALTGRGYQNLADFNFKLPDLLRDQGYQVYFLLSGDHTHLHGYWDILSRGVDLCMDGTKSARFSPTDDRILFEALENQVPDFTGTPAFFFFHLMSVHFTGVRWPEYERYKPCTIDAGELENMWYFLKKDYDREAMTNRYDNGIMQGDAVLKDLFAMLDKKGYLKDALAVIIADHGEGIGEHGNYSHSKYLHQEDIRIPLLIYDDPAFHYAHLEFAAQIDVSPTIAERLGLPIPACWEGHSLLDPNIKEYSFHTTQRQPVSRAVLHRTPDGVIYKYICRYAPWHADDAPPESEELYEISTDPGEAHDLMPTAPHTLVEPLRERLRAEFAPR